MAAAQYIDIIFDIVILAAIILLIKPQRIKALLPVSFVAVIVLFVVEVVSINLGLYKFNSPLLPILGIPFFHLLWSAFGAILVMNYMKKEFSKKVIIILFFTVASGLFGYISDKVGGHSHLGNFNELTNFVLDFAALSLFVWASEGIFGERIYQKEQL